MGYERYTLEEAQAKLAAATPGHFTVHILIVERPPGTAVEKLERTNLTVRASTLDGAVTKAQSHLNTELESIRAEAGSATHHEDPYPGRDA